MMKRFYLIVALAAWLPWSVVAQDARQRTAATVVADALAQLPASTQDTYNQVMGELSGIGADAVVEIAGMLVPADKGKNAMMEYALNGVVAYASAPGREKQAAEVRKGLTLALEKCTDNPNRAFLLTLLQRCAQAEDAPVFVKYLNDDYLAEWALNGLVATPGTEEVLFGLMTQEAAPRQALAYAAGAKKLAAAEPILLAWTKEADAETLKAVYHALGICGSAGSLKVLGNAAKKVDYAWEDSDATAAYLRLLRKLVNDGQGKAALPAAKKLLKATDKANVRGAALDVVFAVEGKKAQPMLLAAMKDACREYRVNALRLSESYADEDTYAALGALLAAKEDGEVKADILNWLGTNHAVSQAEAVVACIGSANEEVALAAIGTAGKLGGDVALKALVVQLGGTYSEAATAALLSFNGKVNDSVQQALEAAPNVQQAALPIVAARRMDEAVDKVFALLRSSDKGVSAAAYEALAGVVKPTDFARLSQLAEQDGGKHTPQLQQAMKQALATLSQEEQLAAVLPVIEKSASPSLYYPVLAQVGNTKAIAALMKGYKGDYKQAAFEALLTVDNEEMMGTLYEIAKNEPAAAVQALGRYTDLVSKSDAPVVRKVQLYSKALEIATDAALQNKLIKLLGNTNAPQVLPLVEKYMDTPATAPAAAQAVRNVVSKNIDKMGGESVRQALLKAIECFRAVGNADAGYAIDDINAMLEKLPAEMSAAAVKFELSPQEAADGFEVLFDGVSMDKWTGNFIDYAPQEDGTLYVSAQYGGSGNLYTVKEYADFVLRFEFCFLREGVNNGVGIRTPMGVDAAYEGMEIQILDHDAPIYKNLREYQVHGSVYGIIPAKRIKSPQLGVWNTEEIIAKGDHITVTVNGEVILDGNIRKACKGHNVSADGGKKNPYTVDKKNHPGLFNKSGHIGFLGHGAGLKLRNIRVKDLSK